MWGNIVQNTDYITYQVRNNQNLNYSYFFRGEWALILVPSDCQLRHLQQLNLSLQF